MSSIEQPLNVQPDTVVDNLKAAMDFIENETIKELNDPGPPIPLGHSTVKTPHPPADLPIDERYRARAVEFSTELCLPYYFPRESETIERLGEELTEDEYLAYWKLQRQLSGTDDDRNHVIHRLLGHADPIQNDMQLECQLRTHGVHEWSGPRVEALRSGAAASPPRRGWTCRARAGPAQARG